MRKLLTFLTLLVLAVGVGWAATTSVTYTFNSKSWGATPANWTGTANGNQFNSTGSPLGVQVTTGAGSGATVTCPTSYNSISKVVVNYASSSKGVGSIEVLIGSTSLGSQNISKSQTNTELTYTASNITGVVKLKPTVTTNSLGIRSVTITYDDGGTPTPTTYNLTGTATNGSVTFSVNNSTVTSAEANATVTATATADSGYEFDSWNQPSGVTNWNENGNIATFTMPASDVTVSANFTQQSSGGGNVYELVTNANQLVAGKEYLITNEDGTVIMGAMAGTGNTYATQVTSGFTTNSTDKTITLSSNCAATPLTLGGSTGAWTLNNGSGFVAYTSTATSSNNYLMLVNDASTNGAKWAISGFPSSQTLISNVYNTSRSIRYNSTNTRFAAYTQNMAAIALYKKVEAAGQYNVTKGTITGSGDISFSASTGNTGDEITVYDSPETGWELTALTANGTDILSTKKFTIANADVTVNATFSKVELAINRVITTNGDNSTDGGWLGSWTGCETVGEANSATGYTVTAFVGSTVTFKAGTNDNYQILDANVTAIDGNNTAVALTKVSSDNSGTVFSFTMPGTPVNITANFTDYRGTLRLAGHFNGNSSWRTGAAGPEFTYDSTNDKYTISAYFTGLDDSGANDYFFLTLDEVERHPQADQGNYYIYDLNGGSMPFNLSGSSSNNFGCAPGIYDIEINGALTNMKFTKATPTLTLLPNGGDVETGQVVTANSNLTSLISNIKAIDTDAVGDVTVGVNTDNGSTWNESVTLSTVGNGQTVYGKAWLSNNSNINATGNASFNVTAVNNSNVYELVTNANQLQANAKYIIMSAASGSGYAMSTTQNTNNRAQSASYTITDSKVTIGSDVQVIILESAGTNWNLKVSDGYLYAAGANSSNHLKTEATVDANGNANAAISITGTTHQILFQGTATRNDLRYNSSNNPPIFSCYAEGGQSAVYLYKQMADVPKAFTVNYATVTGGSATGATGADAGETITVTVTPDNGYACSGVVVTTDEPDNSPLTVTDNNDGTYSFTVPSNFNGTTITVTPSFAAAIAITYVADPAAGGTVTGPASAVEASTVVVTVTPNADYQISSVVYTWGSAQSSVDVPIVNGNYQFQMPTTPTTVTATFEKIPHTITVTSAHGEVTGYPSTATSGTSVTFTVTASTPYIVSSVTGTFNNGNSSLNITDNGNGTYTFNMPASDVAITVTYFASEDYELLTDLSDINAEDTYLLVGGAASGTTKDFVMGNAGSGQRDGVELTSSNYDSTTGIITSTADMAIVNFVAGSGDYSGKWAIHTAAGYLNNTSTSGNGLTAQSSPAYATITLGDNSKATIQLVNNSSRGLLSYNTGGNMWKFYGGSQGANYIFKLANVNKVKRPTVTGIGTSQNIGLYNFIGRDTVTLECATEGATIQYSLDNGTTWNNYSAPFEITTNAAGNTVEVLTRGIKAGMDNSDEVTATFTCIKPTAPTFSEYAQSGTYYNPLFAYPKSALADRRAYGQNCATFYYVTDGSTTGIYPNGTEVTTSNSNGYYIYLDDDASLNVVTVINGIASDPTAMSYEFEVAAPVMSLDGGEYDGNQQTRLSTETKSTLNNKTWTTKIYYTTGNTNFAFNSTTGEVTSTGWIEYDATNAPYIDLLVEDSPITLRAVTLSNYFDNVSEYRVSAVSSETYTLTAAKLSVVASPAAGTYVNAVNVTLEAKNAVGNYLIYYTTDGSDPSNNGIEYTGTPITVDHDMTIKVYAVDSRSGESGTATLEAAYKIGVQAPVFSPVSGTYYKGDDNDIDVEIFSVTPNAKIYYTYTDDGSTPADPTNASTLYSGNIPLETGKTYNFKAIAYVGSSRVSAISSATYTIQAKGSGWLNVKEMAESSAGTTKTLDNPVQVVYMSTWRYNGEKPEFAFVRDNSGYGLIYFGGSGVSGYNSYTKYQMGDWLAGGTIRGTMANWENSFINELGSNTGSIASWPSSSVGNTAILPEETTNAAIKAGWTYEGSYTGSDYATYIDAEKNMFGHYVHMRKNTISNLSLVSQKYLGQITDQSGVPLNYYDGLYLFSGHNGRPTYDQAFFDNIQTNGGTVDIYGIVYFYGKNAQNADYSYAPFEIFPIDFEWIYKPKYNIISGTYHETQTVTLTCDTQGAQIWYKTSEMEDYDLYTGPITVDATTTIEAYSTLPSKFGDQLESVIETLNITMGTIEQPVISPESSVNAIGATPVTCTITCETEDATIYYTTDGSDPKTSETRQEYTEALTISETTTVRAVAYSDNGNDGGYYSVEAEQKTYTFVKSNGIEYQLVTSASQLNESSVYVIVNQNANIAMGNTQKTNNRDGEGVLFKNNEKTIVYGNDALAMITLEQHGNQWYMHTSNGANSVSSGYLYGASSGTTNQLLTEATADDNAAATINIGSNNEAQISFLYDGTENRYLRFWSRDNLFNTYSSESNAPVYLYYIAATPLATIEKTGEVGNQYTIADQLIGVYAQDEFLWCKDQGNVSISKTENTEGYADYMKDILLKGDDFEWDQSNWIVLDFSNAGNNGEDVANSGVGKFITPASIQGTLTNDVNFKMEVACNSSYTLPVDGAADFTILGGNLNTYCPVNFLEANQNGGAVSQFNGEHYYFVNPKVQEIVNITYAIWDGSKFVVAKSQENELGFYDNGHDFDGAFNVAWTYNGDGQHTNPSASLEVNKVYSFQAIIQRPESTGQGSPRRAGTSGKENQTPDNNIIVYPTNLTDESIITEVKNVVGAREVKSVKYVNVAGVVSDRPFDGVNIIVTEYTDGSRSTVKQVR